MCGAGVREREREWQGVREERGEGLSKSRK